VSTDGLRGVAWRRVGGLRGWTRGLGPHFFAVSDCRALCGFICKSSENIRGSGLFFLAELTYGSPNRKVKFNVIG